MKVICDRAALLDAVNLVAAAVPARTPSLALSCLRLAATRAAGTGTLLLAGTDNELAITLAVPQVDVGEPGVTLLPADKLRQIVQVVDSEPTLTLETDGETCQIRGSASRFRIFGAPAQDYPALPDPAGPQAPPVRAVFAVPAGTMLALIARTVFATARETSRYAVNGVLLKRDGKRLEMVATDGRRLARARAAIRTAGDAAPAAVQCIVPTKALNLLTRLIRDPEESVRITVTDTRVFFALAESTRDGTKDDPRAVLSTVLVEGAFPPYEDVIPTDSDRRATVEREALQQALRLAAVLTNEESRGVRMIFAAAPRRVRLTSRAPEMGEAEIDVPLAAFEGQDLEISFNPHFIIEALKAVDEPEVVVELKAPNKPGLVRAGSDFLYVVMPVNLPQ